MIVQNDICNIHIWVDDMYTVDSSDNKPYDLVINPRGYKQNDLYKVLALQIHLFDETICIALVGDFYSYEIDCAILDNDILTVLQNNAIVQLRVTDGTMLLYRTFDCFGYNYGIYKVKKGYIIYGEIEITMLDFDVNKKWSFSGRDIFVSLSEKRAFELCENSIKLYDFEDNFYEIDFEGKLLSES